MCGLSESVKAIHAAEAASCFQSRTLHMGSWLGLALHFTIGPDELMYRYCPPQSFMSICSNEGCANSILVQLG